MRALVENPYYQLFCGEEFFCHQLPFDRSSLTRWRQRMGEDKLVALIQESLAVATRMGAAKPADFRQVVIDTTVQEKAIAFPTDAKLMHRARERLVRLAQARGVTLRQSYVRVGKIALIRHQRYAHAKQFKRATRALRSLRTMLGRVIRDITRKIVGRPDSQTCSRCRSRGLAGSRISASASVAGSSTRCMLPRSSALAKERPTNPMSSASRSAWRRPSTAAGAASCRPREGAPRQSL